jgi:hypothetical protein
MNDIKFQSGDSRTLCICVVPNKHTGEVYKRYLAHFDGYGVRIKVTTPKEFKNNFVRLNNTAIGEYDRLFIYFDEVTFMDISYDELVKGCAELHQKIIKAPGTIYDMMLTFMMTSEHKPTLMDSLSSLVQDNPFDMDFMQEIKK